MRWVCIEVICGLKRSVFLIIVPCRDYKVRQQVSFRGNQCKGLNWFFSRKIFIAEHTSKKAVINTRIANDGFKLQGIIYVIEVSDRSLQVYVVLVIN